MECALPSPLVRFIPACAGNRRPRPAGPAPFPVHPRVCGEQAFSMVGFASNRGSSPRVRGTDAKDGGHGEGNRFIPACAGNRVLNMASLPRRLVHPRVCGEQDNSATPHSRHTGSSPRVRGTAVMRGHHLVIGRFIPACAGNRARQTLQKPAQPVHPRVCGEQSRAWVMSSGTTGSSPRVRGTALARGAAALAPRFIPACAGNRGCALRGWARAAVHPRVCGEQGEPPTTISDVPGSSPRVRGTGQPSMCFTGHHRFIPACAGNSIGATRDGVRELVHPRVCGEQRAPVLRIEASDGSSPRVRGTAPEYSSCADPLRFIPACAGNSQSFFTLHHDTTVHPRVCGEQRRSRFNSNRRCGSSPRVRGTGGAHRARGRCPRFIPACAGNRNSGRSEAMNMPVHPRVCGEQNRSPAPTLTPIGSSPRVRGTEGLETPPERFRGFIPACAGNRMVDKTDKFNEAVHPRVCGEQRPLRPHRSCITGSSPRVRGTVNPIC